MAVSSSAVAVPFLPDGDSFHDSLYCEKCQCFLREPCWQHAVFVQDAYSLPLAFASLPDNLGFHHDNSLQNVEQSSENSAIPSVVARTAIRPQTVFGPFIAPLCDVGAAHSRTYSSADGQHVTCSPGNDHWCNWMKLVRTVDHGQHNLRVFIREHKVLFVAVKVILPGEELTLALPQIDRKEIIDSHVNYVAVSMDVSSGTYGDEISCLVKSEDDGGQDSNMKAIPVAVALDVPAACFSVDARPAAQHADQIDLLACSQPLPAPSEGHTPAPLPLTRSMQRENSPEYPFPSSFRPIAPDASLKAASHPEKRQSDEKESTGVASKQTPFSRVYSLRGRNVASASLACSDDDFSDDRNEDFWSAADNVSSSTESDYCSEVEVNLDNATPKRRGRKRRTVNARAKLPPKKIGTVGAVLPICRSGMPNELAAGCSRVERMRRLNAVAKINPLQFSSRSERSAAWKAVWQAYTTDDVASKNSKFSCRKLQIYVQYQLENFSILLDRYNENTTDQDKREYCSDGHKLDHRYIEVMRVIAQQAGKDYADAAHPLAIHTNGDVVGLDQLDLAADTGKAPPKPLLLENYEHDRCRRYFSYVYRFVCWECSLHFMDETLLNLHKLQHTDSPGEAADPRDCPVCRRSFSKLSNLLRHVIDHGAKASQIVHFIPTADPSIMCFACKTAAPMDVLAQSHDAHETCFLYSCGLNHCGLRFCTESMADLHQLSHKVPDNYQGDVVCAGCNHVAANAEDLLKHVGRHGAKLNDHKMCRLCGKFVPHMVEHVQTNHKEGYLNYEACLTLPCDQCEKRFRTPIHLATHKACAPEHRSRGSQVLGCQVCAKQFPSSLLLHAHVKKDHATGLKCMVCQKSYSKYLRLQRHSLTHQEIHVCNTCGSVFRSKQCLVQHEFIHRSDYSFKCDLCGKTFKRSCNLWQHRMIVHTDKMRKKRQAKREEMRRKGVVSEYKCPRRRMLYEEFPFKCEECRLGWMLLGNLQQHQRKKHSQNVATV